MPYSVTPPVGRLVVVQVLQPFTLEELNHIGMSLRATLSKLPPPGGILATDLTHTSVWPPGVASAFVELMRSGNKLLVASALLTPGVGTFAMQIERVVKEAGHPQRMAFHKRADFDAWLTPQLTPVELQHFRKSFKPAL